MAIDPAMLQMMQQMPPGLLAPPQPGAPMPPNPQLNPAMMPQVNPAAAAGMGPQQGPAPGMAGPAPAPGGAGLPPGVGFPARQNMPMPPGPMPMGGQNWTPAHQNMLNQLNAPLMQHLAQMGQGGGQMAGGMMNPAMQQLGNMYNAGNAPLMQALQRHLGAQRPPFMGGPY